MRRRAFVAALLASSILLASCSALDTGSSRRRNRDRDRDDDDGNRTSFTRPAPETSAETVPMPSETRAPAETTETTAASTAQDAEVSPEVYASYLEVLEANEDEIRAYDWMGMETAAPDSERLIAYSDTPCALVDLTGDGLEELLIMSTTTGYNADLHVYTYNSDTGSCEPIMELQGFDVLAGGGGRFLIAQLTDGYLLIYKGEGDEDWTDVYAVFGFLDTSTYLGGRLECDTHLDDGQSSYVHEYTLNGDTIDEDTFEESKSTMIDYIGTVIMYNFVSDPDMVSALSDMTPIAMSYDDMHSYLEGLS